MNIPHDLPRSTPEAQGVSSSALNRFIDAVEQKHLELHSLMLLRHGVVIAEGWWSPYRADYRHLLNSVSKSFTSTAIGLAAAESHLSIDDPVISFFPDAVPDVISDHLAALRIKHLLSMSTGHAEDTVEAVTHRLDKDWVQTFLSIPIAYPPGTHFVYNSGATYMLSAILQKVTGIGLLDYLRPRLLTPLGITNATWDVSPQGIQLGGWGMSIPTEAIARFGQLYLQQGVWNGQQLVPAAWIAEATSRQIDNAERSENADGQQGYGYQFWRCQHNAYRGDGAFGQFCIVMPDQDVVLAMTAGLENMQAVMDLVWEHILPGIQTDKTLSEQPEAVDQLTRKLASLHIDPPAGNVDSALSKQVSGRAYTLEANSLAIETIRFDFSASGCKVSTWTTTGEQHFKAGIGTWQPGTLALFDHSPLIVASGVWTADHTFTLTLRFYETPAIYTMECHFTENKLTIAIQTVYLLNLPTYSPIYSLAGYANAAN